MSTISELSPQKNKKERYNIYIDGKFAFGANIETILKYHLKTGKKLPQKLIAEIVKKEELAKLFDSSLKFLSYRPRSQKETEQFLTKKIASREHIKYSEAKESDLIREVIKKLTKYKYINDLEFTKWWVDSRSKTNPKGQRLIKSELLLKGIDREIVDHYLGKLTDQASLAKAALDKKIKKWHKLSSIDFKKKSYAYLASRGFEFETIKDTVAKLNKKR